LPATVKAELDLARLAALPAALGMALPEIVATIARELDEALSSAQSSIAEGDLEAVDLAAHAGRNSALMLGPNPLLEALGLLEASASRGDAAGAAAALMRARSLWPELRRQLVRAGGAEAET
jgi:hypothetical protein